MVVLYLYFSYSCNVLFHWICVLYLYVAVTAGANLTWSLTSNTQQRQAVILHAYALIQSVYFD